MRWLSYLLVALGLGYMGFLTANLWSRVQDLDFHLQAGPLVVSVILLIGLFLLDAYGWLRILAVMEHKPPIIENIRIWLLSSVARYLPGGIWSYVSRADMTRRQGIDLASISVALYLETLLLAASSLVIGLPALIIAGGYVPSWWQILSFSVLTMLAFHPESLRLLRYLPGKIGRSFSKVSLPSFRDMIALYVYYLLFWCLFGITFILFVNMLHPLPPRQWLPVGSSIGLSFFAGFVMVFVPGGIGVRESVLYVLLEPLITAPAALVVSVGSRVWIMAGEGLSLALAEAAFSKRKKAY